MSFRFVPISSEKGSLLYRFFLEFLTKMKSRRILKLSKIPKGCNGRTIDT